MFLGEYRQIHHLHERPRISRNGIGVLLFGWLKRRLRPTSTRPVLMRVRSDRGGIKTPVRVEAVQLPEHRRSSHILQTANGGLCVLPWPITATSLVLKVEHDSGAAIIEVRGDRQDPQRVIEVDLVEAV